MLWYYPADYIPDEDIDILDAYEYQTQIDVASGSNWSIENQLIVNNRLLGIIVALLILFMIAGLIRFFYRLIVDNITNFF